MQVTRRKFCTALGALPLLSLGGVKAQTAASYPNRPLTLTLIVPPGGVSDSLFRQLAKSAEPFLGQNVIIDYRPGGGSLVGLNYLRSQNPDGYSLAMVGRSVLSRYWITNQNIGFHPVEDLTWLSRVYGSAFAVVVRADSPFQSWADVVAYAKSQPDTLSYGGFTAFGGMTHVAIEDIAQKEGLKMQYIPYKGDADVLQAVMGGQLDFAVVAGTFKPLAEAGRVRPLVFLTPERQEQYPDVPTMIEAGYPVTVDASVGIAAPKGLPPDVVAKLEEVIQKAMATPEFVAVLDHTLQMPTYLDNQGFTEWAGKQIEVERDIVERFNLRER
ncbi:MAG: tripartite tricarboxylate transporter substrate binding protein [Pigmentiphaga sp.]|nr:tripartite tricarboxylate transporter substrate binding protein [Pigmentiphaga sp.]